MNTNDLILNHPLYKDAIARLVFIDGQYAPEFSKTADLVGLAIIADRQTALLDYVHLMPEMIIQDQLQGFFCYLSKNAVIERPIHFLFIFTGKLVSNKSTIQFSNLLIAQPTSSCKILVEYLGETNITSEIAIKNKIILANKSKIQYLTLQNHKSKSNFEEIFAIKQDEASHFFGGSFLFGGASWIENLNVLLQGKDARCDLYGLHHLNEQQKSVSNLKIDHLVPYTESHTLYKNIISGQAEANFVGLIKIAPLAQKSIADLKNYNLLLSEGASINTAPELEVYADDVKCTHGSTVGCLDEESLFYLRSRGITEKNAKEILVDAFARELMEKIENESLRAYINKSFLFG